MNNWKYATWMGEDKKPPEEKNIYIYYWTWFYGSEYPSISDLIQEGKIPTEECPEHGLIWTIREEIFFDGNDADAFKEIGVKPTPWIRAYLNDLVEGLGDNFEWYDKDEEEKMGQSIGYISGRIGDLKIVVNKWLQYLVERAGEIGGDDDTFDYYPGQWDTAIQICKPLGMKEEYNKAREEALKAACGEYEDFREDPGLAEWEE